MSIQEQFLKEIKEVFKKYGAVIDEYDDYDSEENPCGTHYTIRAGELINSTIYLSMNELMDKIDEA